MSYKLLIVYMKVLVNPHSARTDFRRQNLTSIDVRFWRLKSIPALTEENISNGGVDS